MRWLSPYILIWKYPSYYHSCHHSHLENSRPVAAVLHITSKGVLCFAFLQKPQLKICLFQPSSASFLLSCQRSTFSVRTLHPPQSCLLSNANESLATQLKATCLFPSDTFMLSVLWLVLMKGRLKWSMDFPSQVFWTITSHISKSLGLKLQSEKRKTLWSRELHYLYSYFKGRSTTWFCLTLQGKNVK